MSRLMSAISSFDSECERLRAQLAEQIESDAFREARETVVALLCLRPNDPDALSAREFLDEQLALIDSNPRAEGRCFRGHTSGVTCVAFSPDATRAMSGSGGSGRSGDLLAREDRSIRLWDVATGREIRRFLGMTSMVTSAVFSADGRHILSGHRGGSMYLWDVEDARMVRRFFRRANNIWAVALSRNGHWALSGGDDKGVHLWEAATGKRKFRLDGHTQPVRAVAFAPDGGRILSASEDKTIRYWDLVNRCRLRRLTGHKLPVLAVAFAPDGRHAISGGMDAAVLLWDLETGEVLRRMLGHQAAINAVAIAADGQRALSGSADMTIRVWDISAGRELHCFKGHADAVTGVAFSPNDGQTFLSSSRDMTVRLWQIPTVAVGSRPSEAFSVLAELPGDTIEDVVRALGETALLEPAQREELLRRLQPRFSDPRALLQQLLEWGWVTPFQIAHLADGDPRELVVGSYVVLDRLGEGGMGEVLKARVQNGKQIVVLKVIRPDLLRNQAVTQQFLAEMQALSRLSHPNVIRTFGACQVNGRHFFAMEFIEGTDLGRLVQHSGPLPLGQACEYIRQAALGLEHAHEHCLVHRDIKPANLLLTLTAGQRARGVPGANLSARSPGAIIKIIDWGLADRRLPQGYDSGTTPVPRNEMVGTADYLAPEQARDSTSANIQSDIYSLGCTLYHLLAGHPPFPGGSLMQKLLKHQQTEPKSIREIRPDVPEGLAIILQKMMAKEPAYRYRTPAMVAVALATFCPSDPSPSVA
jgi:WD40 repeat protein